MAQKITPEQIQAMVQLYSELGTYTAVAKKLGISSSTVSKYLKQVASIRTYSDAPAAKPIEEITAESILSYSCLTDEEKASYQEWMEEFN